VEILAQIVHTTGTETERTYHRTAMQKPGPRLGLPSNLRLMVHVTQCPHTKILGVAHTRTRRRRRLLPGSLATRRRPRGRGVVVVGHVDRGAGLVAAEVFGFEGRGLRARNDDGKRQKPGVEAVRGNCQTRLNCNSPRGDSSRTCL
jgi:hypothetical protein